MSTKYIWYFFQKILAFSKKFILFFLLYSSINAQISDTIQFKYKDSKVLIVSKGTTDNEWEFEKSINEEKNTQKKFKLNFSLGNMQLNTNSIFNGVNSFSPIRYKAFSSVNINFSIYLKYFDIKKEYLKLFIGVGIGKNKLDLDRQLVSISQDTMFLINSSLMSGLAGTQGPLRSSISKSILAHHYFTLPINLSWTPFHKKKPNIKAELDIINQFLMAGKSELKFNINDLEKREITKNNFFNNNYHLSGNLRIIYKNIGVFFQTNISQYSKLYKNLFTYSYGLTLCI